MQTKALAELAHRYTPSPVVALDRGARIWVERGKHGRGQVTRAEGARRLTHDGALEAWPA